MTPLLVWARRSVAVVLAPIVLVALLSGAWSSADGWQYEWLWGLRKPVRVLPLVAAGVAFDTSRRWTPLVGGLGPAARRWRRATLAIPVVHVLWAFACLCVVWAAVAVRLWLNEAFTRPDPWLPFEALASLAAAATVGLVSSAVGMTRDAQAAEQLIGLNLAVTALCCLLALRGPRPSWPWATGIAALAAVLVALVALPLPEYEYRPVGGPEVCASRADVRVCGSQVAEPLAQDLSLALQQAVDDVTGLPFPQTYELGVPGVLPTTEAGRTVANVSPVQLRGASRDRTVAEVLALPRTCPQLLDGGEDTDLLLERQAQVRAWLEGALRTPGSTAPPEIQAAYGELLTCRATRP